MRSRPDASSIALGLLAALALLATACTSTEPGNEPEPTAVALTLQDAPVQYDASWTIDAEAVGADGPGYPFLYREVVDNRMGRFLVQSPNHLATQDPDLVVLCAAIFRVDPYCAATTRADATPSVYSYPVQLLRTWGPTDLYDLATWREVKLVAAAEPAAWQRRSDVLREVRVDCFAVVGDTLAARTGFEICFTDDDVHLVASVDLQGDFIYEIDLQSYDRVLDDDSFVTGLEDFIEAKASVQDQLIVLFPEIPAPRPTPTPDPLGDSSS